MAPAGTPKEIVDKLAAEMVAAVKDPKFAEQLTVNGVDPLAEGPAKFAEMIAKEIPIWAEAVRIAGVKLQ
jgi:tripartite-type tricarboxylate transporter receptor subunit TctC